MGEYAAVPHKAKQGARPTKSGRTTGRLSVPVCAAYASPSALHASSAVTVGRTASVCVVVVILFPSVLLVASIVVIGCGGRNLYM